MELKEAPVNDIRSIEKLKFKFRSLNSFIFNQAAKLFVLKIKHTVQIKIIHNSSILKKNLKIYVIVVTYNGKKWIDKCLQSIINSTYSLSIVIVDNQSTDGTIPHLRNNYQDVIIIETGSNLGFGKANNIGMKYALENNADYVFLLNQDAYIYSDMIEKMLNVPDLNSYGILSPIHLNGDSSGLDEHFKHFVSSLAIPEYLEDMILNRVKPVYECKFVNAAGWLIQNSTIRRIGGFDPIFYHYGEDNHYCQRTIFHKFKIGICTQAYMNHDRIIVGNELLFQKSIERRYLLDYYLNINLNKNEISKNIRNRHFKNIMRLFDSIFRFNIKEVKNICDAYWFVTFHKKTIKINRKINSKEGLLWL